MFCWAINMSYERATPECTRDGIQMFSETICDWYHYCRELVADFQIGSFASVGIGGPGVIVQIDEAKF